MVHVFFIHSVKMKLVIFFSNTVLEYLLVLVICELRVAAVRLAELDDPDDEPGEGDDHVLTHVAAVICPEKFRLHELQEKFKKMFLTFSTNRDAGEKQSVHDLHLCRIECYELVKTVVIQIVDGSGECCREVQRNVSVLLYDVSPGGVCLFLEQTVLESYHGANCVEESLHN